MKCIHTITLLHTSLMLLAQAGNLLPSFGSGGKVITDIGSNLDVANSIAIQADGKLVVAGRTGALPNYDFALCRYNSDGSLDNTFGKDGKVVTAISNGNDVAYAIVIQDDGKILVSGGGNSSSGSTFFVARYTTDGTLDNSFAAIGIAFASFPALYTFAGRDIALQKDGKIIVVGAANGPDNNLDLAITRFNPNGTTDSAFGKNGHTLTGFHQSSIDRGECVAIQDDGKIVIAGISRVNTSTPFQFHTVRYNNNGTIDSTFGAFGKFTAPSSNINSQGSSANDIALQHDGKIVLAGSTSANNNSDWLVVRLNKEGSLDTSFNNTGMATTDFYGNSDFGRALAVQNDGKIIVAGDAFNGFDRNATISRFTSNGSLDPTFGTAGKYVVEISNGDEAAFGIKFFNHTIYTCGSITLYGLSDFLLTAHQNDAFALPVTFINFTAAQKDGAILLRWQTSREINTSEYIIEQSDDGVNFIKVGQLKATSKDFYRYNIPSSTNSKASFYRIKSVDRDGQHTYSKSILIRTTKIDKSYAFPNPAKNRLTIHTSLFQVVQVVVYDVNGKVVYKTPVTNTTVPISIDIANLNNGLYSVVIKAKDKSEILSFVKQ